MALERFGDKVRQRPAVLRSLTGLTADEYAPLEQDALHRLTTAEQARRQRPQRRRAVGAGRPFALAVADPVLLTVVWLRQYPTHKVLALLFDLGAATLAPSTPCWLIPPPSVVIDRFEQRVPRLRRRTERDGWYSGKKRMHTIKSQIGVDEDTGTVVDVAGSVPRPTADLVLLDQSGLLQGLPAEVGASGDVAYVSIDRRHPTGLRGRPGASRAGGTARPGTRSPTKRSPAGGWWSSTRLAGCAPTAV